MTGNVSLFYKCKKYFLRESDLMYYVFKVSPSYCKENNVTLIQLYCALLSCEIKKKLGNSKLSIPCQNVLHKTGLPVYSFVIIFHS